jgi:hypothetical protein
LWGSKEKQVAFVRSGKEKATIILDLLPLIFYFSSDESGLHKLLL